ncbi:hypothetical protein BDZ91DRAFT_723886 [Kalaharituber pfeilii]|nr:hypothetical protein BDZ91DRAFT_723886 [Kalaharituber pfeilii]
MSIYFMMRMQQIALFLHQPESNPEPESLSRPPISTSEAIQSIDSLMYYMESLPVSSLDHTGSNRPSQPGSNQPLALSVVGWAARNYWYAGGKAGAGGSRDRIHKQQAAVRAVMQK